MQKQETIAATMRLFMESGPSTTEFTSYKALNDYVGAAHGLPAGKCQALAGAKAWAWAKDETSGKWRLASPEEVEACKAKAAGKAHGGPRSKVLSDEERAVLEAQIAALEAVGNPALAPLLADLRGKVIADDQARKGSMKDRLAAAIDTLTLARAVAVLEWQIAAVKNAAEAGADEAGADEAAEAPDA